MGGLAYLKVELEELTVELEEACQVPDAPQQPEVVRARALVEQARGAVAAAFLSRRALVLAKQAVASAHQAVTGAIDVSRVLRERSQVQRTQAAEIREATAEARAVVATLSRPPRREEPADDAAGEVVLESAIPAEHPEKRAIEAAATQILARGGGQWHVWITVPPGARWWGLRVRGPGIDWVATLQDAGEQRASVIESRLLTLAQIAMAEARYRRSVRPSRRRTLSAYRGGTVSRD